MEQKKVIDSRGSFCPGPITDLFKAYRQANLGDVIELLATDPAAKSDVTAWAKKSGNELLGIVEEQGYIRIDVKITKKGR
ncbi:MAG: sulfurtransferase TusA family protein [Nitrososphaerota archaeon]|nr:sulfurtransferase TusA family protein [Nitrososphaerota archaeon]